MKILFKSFHPSDMKIALSYISSFREDSRYFNKIMGDVEAIEVKTIADLKTTFLNKELILHLNKGIVDNSWSRFFSEGKKGLLNKIKYMSLDFGPSCKKSRFIPNQGLFPQSSILTVEEIIKQAEKNLKIIRKYFPGMVALENLDYRPTGAYEHITDPAPMSDFINRHKLKLLLDLAHAKISAAHRRDSIESYLEKLPLSQVYEIHLNSPVRVGDFYVDRHLLPTEEDYRLLFWVLGRTKPAYITIEYQKNYRLLLKEIKKLRAYLDKLTIP